jgi:hypothetical protein
MLSVFDVSIQGPNITLGHQPLFVGQGHLLHQAEDSIPRLDQLCCFFSNIHWTLQARHSAWGTTPMQDWRSTLHRPGNKRSPAGLWLPRLDRR